jgi:SAM-dependent methyltransferase
MWHLDQPQLAVASTFRDTLEFSGWIAGSEQANRLRLADGNPDLARSFRVSLLERPDVASVLGMPGLHTVGFEGSCALDPVRDQASFSLHFDYQGECREIVIPVHRGPAHSIDNKADKLERMVGILQCPACCLNGLSLDSAVAQLRCDCGASYDSRGSHNFLTEEASSGYQLDTTDKISENQYDGEILNIINRHQHGWVLDCGAGRRDTYYENVVNFEIVDYDSTDVMGLAEQLPFRDCSFDAVLSCAVLEHVKDPFRCAAEISRVLKPGGTLYCQAPFLQPFHGYPNHYYNMTSQGLLNLFADSIEVEHLAPLNFGQPAAALNWILQSYAAGLPENLRDSFLDTPVRELIRPNNETLLADYVSQLGPETRDELACCNLLVGTKR